MSNTTKEVVGETSGSWAEGKTGRKVHINRLCETLASKLTDHWSVGEKMTELKRIYRLKKQDREAFTENSGKEIDHNETFISFLRTDNRAKRIMQAQYENGDSVVIKQVFEADREEMLGLQRFTASEAIQETNQKSKAAAKLLNALRYESGKCEKRLKDLNEYDRMLILSRNLPSNRKQKIAQNGGMLQNLRYDLNNEYERMLILEPKSPEQQEAEESTTQLENALDKAFIKYDTAHMISHRYGEILDSLKENSLTLPTRLDAMEQALLMQKKELRELREMGASASNLRNEARKQLRRTEYKSIESRKQREAELQGLRKEVERRKIDVDKSDKKPFRASLLTDQQDVNVQGEQQLIRERQKKILTYEAAIQRIKEATHVTAIGGVVLRVVSQQETKSKLRKQVSELESQTHRLRDEREKMKTLYHDLKYSGSRKLSKAQQLLEETHDHLRRETRRRDGIFAGVERGAVTMVNLKTGVAMLLEKLADVKLPPPHFNHVKSGDVYEQMDLARNKLHHLMKRIEKQNEFNRDASDVIVSSEFQDFLESQLPPDNTCIRFQTTEEGHVTEYGFDSQENEVLTRTDIKNMSQKMMMSMEKKKKKKTKQKK